MTLAEKRIQKFCEYLHKQEENHSLYLWGGQGEQVETNGRNNLKIVAEMETTIDKAQAVADKLMDCYFKGLDMSKARYFDCSGLGVYYFLKKGFITSDKTANGLYKLCKDHPKMDDLKPGDFVFKSFSGNNWGHIGYCSGRASDGSILVTESRGRAYGVVTRPLYAGDWKATGRPDFWEKETA